MTTLGHFGPHQTTAGAKSCQPKVLEPAVRCFQVVTKRESGLTVLPLSVYESGNHRTALRRQNHNI
jgi:hypothetical protein